MPGGLLINGKLVEVPGVNVVQAKLSPEDYRVRPGWPQQWILHKTIADDPESVLPGTGPSRQIGGAKDTLDNWTADKRSSATQLITGFDGEVLCCADLALIESFHATVSNALSVGIESKELKGGAFYEATLRSTVLVTLRGCRALGIQYQIPKLAYKGKPLRRMLDGGKNVVGILGHRDNTNDRGRWDPGDILFATLRDRGVEAFDVDAGEDLDVWSKRQNDINKQGDFRLVVDGIPGRATTAALKKLGYIDGIWALGKGATSIVSG